MLNVFFISTTFLHIKMQQVLRIDFLNGTTGIYVQIASIVRTYASFGKGLLCFYSDFNHPLYILATQYICQVF